MTDLLPLLALTIFARKELILARVVRMLTAVAAVPVASPNIVIVVADFVTLEFHDRASGCLEGRVKTFAFVAIGVLLHVASLVTAITAIPATGAVVVIVVTVFVTTVLF